MSADLLARLRVKNQPNKPDVVGIVIKPPEQRRPIELKTTIVDRRETGFDRGLFMADIATIVPVVKRPDILLPTKEKYVGQASEPTKDPVKEPVKAPVATKIKKKLKLVAQEPAAEPSPEKKHKSPLGITRVLPEGQVQIGIATMAERMAPKPPSVIIKASSYYMDNREIFINFINSLFAPYKQELKDTTKTASCDSRSGDFGLMAHQKIIRDYINLYTPYRGILLYHGLGSGKTCSSIAIAEGMKDNRKIIVMTPASLRRNYYEELKKCGDTMYKKNQFWEFVPVTEDNIRTLSSVLNLTLEYIKAQSGAWLVNIKKKSNYETLNAAEKKSLDRQLDEMIRYKYDFISYNGLRSAHLKRLTTGPGGKINPFDNTVVIIDEAHNMVSRIVNKLSRKSGDSVSVEIYELLMTAENVRIILLSGTPIINYPNEIAILFNILRGYIKTWHLKLTIKSDKKVIKQTFVDMFKSTVNGGNVTDFIDYKSSTTILTITRNPFGFVNKTSKGVYDGVRLSERENMNDAEFMRNIARLLEKEKITITNTRVEMFKALPDGAEDFNRMFISSENEVQNMNMFKRRVLGLTSYFRSAQENLMPRYSRGSDFYIVDVVMSDFQFGVYEEARAQERKQEVNNAKKKKQSGAANIFEDSSSTYRVYSRAFCNFVFPRPHINRPLPSKSGEGQDDEDVLDSGNILDNIDGRYEADELDALVGSADATYDAQTKAALGLLYDRRDEFLTGDALEIYSPKFKTMLDNIQNPEHKGLHLVYSQLRTLEGIGIFKIVLEANGFAEFRIINTPAGWRLDVPREQRGKPMFVLYTGTETAEQKEIVRNVFNGDWKYIPTTLEADVRTISGNNIYGEVIKVFMITASGAEGISLKNTRFVHIMEPYWHPVRIQQVIGRARRICSHQDLPPELRTVDVFLYLMQFSEKQLDSDATIELRLKDKSKRDGVSPFTSDQALWEIACLKEEVTDKLLDAVKESSIDCSIHSNGTEKLKCFTFGAVGPNSFSHSGSFAEENTDIVAEQNMQTITLDAEEILIQGVKYAIVRKTGDIYDWDSYMNGRPVQTKRLVKTATGYEVQEI